jgi:LysM repeat protein
VATTLPFDGRGLVPSAPRAPALEGTAAGCPALGLDGDRATYYLVPTTAHVCYVEGEAHRAPTLYQEAFCLSGRHLECPVWRGREHLSASHRRGARTPDLLELSLSARLCAGAAAAILLIGGLSAALMLHGSTSRTAPHAAAAQRPASVPATSLSRTQEQAALTSSVLQPTASPATPMLADEARTVGHALTAALTAPMPVPAPQVYVVRAGDSLSSVARQAQVSVAALAQANGLAPTARLVVGQRLVIPAAAR